MQINLWLFIARLETLSSAQQPQWEMGFMYSTGIELALGSHKLISFCLSARSIYIVVWGVGGLVKTLIATQTLSKFKLELYNAHVTRFHYRKLSFISCTSYALFVVSAYRCRRFVPPINQKRFILA